LQQNAPLKSIFYLLSTYSLLANWSRSQETATEATSQTKTTRYTKACSSSSREGRWWSHQ